MKRRRRFDSHDRERMNVGSWFKSDTWRLSKQIWVLISVMFGAVFVFLTTPWMTLGAVGAIAAVVAGAARAEKRHVGLLPIPAWAICGLLLATYIFVSTLWSRDPQSTAVCALVTALLTVGVHGVSSCFAGSSPQWLGHASRAAVVAFIVALLFLLGEELSDDLIKRTLFWPFKALKWRAGQLLFDPSAIVRISPASVKWNMPPLNFLLWPMLLLLALQMGKAARWPQVAIALATFGTTMLSDHKTSQAAFVLALCALIAARWKPALVRRTLAASWLLGFALIVPVSEASFKGDLHLAKWIGPTMAARIILWNYTAEHFFERPLLGVGAAATRRMDNEMQATAPRPDGFTYALRSGPHAHNIFLQSWYELGAVGTAIFFMLGMFVINLVGSAPARAQPYLLATLMTVIVTGSSSFGLFEPWFMGAFAMTAIVAALSVAAVDRGEAHDG